MLKKLSVFTIALGVISLVLAAGTGDDKKSFELTIIHTNDNHANHDPQSSGGTAAMHARRRSSNRFARR